ncbi:MAG: hypothetical protein COB67_08620 [SAR324 cluster bacterium]|uniref:Haem-binding uptake Tiki superfamily ChaN domain-containing protein n=1 Tax=SAR324 cluster bacterium TaxID=2024889 RepID=A0A2A4T262_9DELT|nr:MAG: hypothetical protein COB67_08620 [SAR324 cluster bacterium]
MNLVTIFSKVLCGFSFLLLTASCSQTSHKRQDPLIGKLFQVEGEKEVKFEKLISVFQKADIIYLSEKHDNTEHHAAQYKVIQQLIKEGLRPKIGLEFFSVDQTGYLMEYVSGKKHRFQKQSPEAAIRKLRKDLGWQYRLDRDWEFYFTFIKLAKKHQLTIFGTDLPRGINRRIAREGEGALTNVERYFLQTTNFQDKSYQQFMYRKLKKAHCGWIEEGLSQRLYQTWVARNDSMAQSLVMMAEGGVKQPIIMIVGGGHTEYSLALYERVAYLQPELIQVNLGLIEISMEAQKLADYLVRKRIGTQLSKPIYDFVWFTQRESFDDPCAPFKKLLKKTESPQVPVATKETSDANQLQNGAF